MKTLLVIIAVIFIFISYSSTYAADSVASVVIAKGEVQAHLNGKSTAIKGGDKIVEGTRIKTASKSFVKLLFNDKSQINVGPESEMLVNQFEKGRPGVLSVLGGQIRAQVEKGGDKNKLFIGTKTASMGVRGTDFSVIFNPQNNVSNTITYSGEVVVAAGQKDLSWRSLDKVMSRPEVVRIREGQFSMVNPAVSTKPTMAVKLSPAQFKVLAQNTNFAEKDKKEKSSERDEKKTVIRSMIPAGLNSRAAMTDNKGLDKMLGEELIQAVKEEKKEETSAAVASNMAVVEVPPAEGLFDKESGAIAPPAGGFIDFGTGLYIPPPPGSMFDENTGVYIPPATLGSFDMDTGSYVNPEGFKLDDSGQFVVDSAAGNEAGSAMVTIESLPPPMSVILTESNVGTEVFAKEDAGITGEVDIGIDTFDEEEAQTVADEILDQYNNTIPEFSPVSMVEFKIIVQ